MARRRGCALVLVLVAIACLISLAAMITVIVLVGREPAVSPRSTLVLRRRRRPGGRRPRRRVLGFLPPARPPTGAIGRRQPAQGEGRFARRAVLLKPTGFESPFWGKVQEIRDAVLDFKKSGKPVYALPRVRRRPRVLPGDGGRQGLPDAVEPARSDGRRHLRAVPARHARQDRRVSRPAPHRRLQDRGQHVHREGLSRAAHREMDESLNRDSLRADRARHRRRPEEDRGRRPAR